MAFGEFSLRDTADSPERARWSHLAHSGSQSQRAIWFILPARGASHVIKYRIDPFASFACQTADNCDMSYYNKVTFSLAAI